MKLIKRLAGCGLVFAVLAGTAFPTQIYAADAARGNSENVNGTIKSDVVSSEVDSVNASDEITIKNYYSFTGTVKEVREHSNGNLFVTTEGADGEPMNFIITNDTVMITENKVKEDTLITVFWDGYAPALMIYPPQMTAVVAAVDPDNDVNIAVDIFDKNLTNSDNTLKLSISDETEILNQNGNKFDGGISELGGKRLVVIYNWATRSIPAQTNPAKVVVLNDKSDDATGGDAIETAPLKAYISFTGTVKKISEINGRTFIQTEGREDENVNFYVTDKTVWLKEAEIKEGSVITVFWDSLSIAPLIFPPQYTALVIAVDIPNNQFVIADIFDDKLTNTDNTLKLNVSDETTILKQDGNKFIGDVSELYGKGLVVVYGPTTRSIPAQTTPYKIIVLDDRTVDFGTSNEADEESFIMDGVTVDVTKMEIVINGKILDGIKPILHGITIMTPLRAVAEAMGFDVGWDDNTRVITVGNILVDLGKGTFTAGSGENIKLTFSSVVSEEGRTYVPWHFFKNFLGVKNSWIMENQIVYDQNEYVLME